VKTAVVIPLKNEKEGLALLVKRLLEQVAPEDEIIFVDAGSTDGTQELIKEYASRHKNIKLFISEGAYPGKGRNIAIQHTNAQLIAQIDGGSLPEKDWLTEICAPLKNGSADYVTGEIRPMPVPATVLGTEIDKGMIFGLSLFGLYRRNKTGQMAGGNSAAYRRWIWEKVGGHAEWCRRGTDVLFIQKIERLQLPLRTTYASDAIVYWQVGPTWRDVFMRKLRFQTSSFMFFRRFPELARVSLVPATLILSLSLPLYHLSYGWISLVLFLFEGGRRGVRTFRNYLHTAEKSKTWPRKVKGYLFFYIFSLETVNVIARVAGLIIGVLNFRRWREFRKKAKDYLNTETDA